MRALLFYACCILLACLWQVDASGTFIMSRVKSFVFSQIRSGCFRWLGETALTAEVFPPCSPSVLGQNAPPTLGQSLEVAHLHSYDPATVYPAIEETAASMRKPCDCSTSSHPSCSEPATNARSSWQFSVGHGYCLMARKGHHVELRQVATSQEAPFG